MGNTVVIRVFEEDADQIESSKLYPRETPADVVKRILAAQKNRCPMNEAEINFIFAEMKDQDGGSAGTVARLFAELRKLREAKV